VSSACENVGKDKKQARPAGNLVPRVGAQVNGRSGKRGTPVWERWSGPGEAAVDKIGTADSDWQLKLRLMLMRMRD
jgi:hypothetical protein